MHTRTLGIILGLGALAARPLASQSTALYDRWTAVSGVFYQSYSFDPGFGMKSASQLAVPVVVVAPIGRQMSLDLSTYVAHSSISLYNGPTETVTGLTDTQLRMLYTMGRDRLVASLSLNLPTGKHSLSANENSVSTTVGSNFLSFPVPNFGTAFGATGGVAYAMRFGSWNVGASGALRYLASYKPLSAQTISYQPGWEGRLRGGADRLLGERARLQLGLTFSTFSTDVYTGSGSVQGGWYDPGARLIGDLGVHYTWGKTRLTFAAWDFYRTAGTVSPGAPPSDKENIFDAAVRLNRQFSPRLQVEPLLEFKQWSPANYRGGRLYTLGVNARYALSDQFSAQVGGGYGPGWVIQPGFPKTDLTSTYLTLLLRYQR